MWLAPKSTWQASQTRYRGYKDMPDLGVECTDLRAGYRRYGVGSHAIFYRLAPDRIEVVRILHQRMDAGRHLL